MANPGFVLRDHGGVRCYACEAFEQIPNLSHGFSIRDGGPDRGSLNLSYSSWDSAARVDENRRRFLAALKMDNWKVATLRQVHSSNVHIIEDSTGEWNQSEGDALATAVERVALAVKVADCFPVLIADPGRRAVAAVHSGWRGTLARIVPKTVQALQSRFGCSPSDLLVAVGPGIRACCFEVGGEVVELFEREYPGKMLSEPAGSSPGKYLLNLCRALEIQLDLSGVRAENRYDLGECTVCNPDKYFSYRAEGNASGRMMAVIGLNRDSD